MIRYSCLHEVALKFNVHPWCQKFKEATVSNAVVSGSAGRTGTAQCQISQHVMNYHIILVP
jgi:hypothetical protein